MKVVFINPCRKIERGNIWSVVNSITPPLGLATLSAVLEREGLESDIIDAAALNLGVSETISRIDPSAEAIGITATTPEIDSVVELSRHIRNRFRSIRIILGGVHPTVFHEELVRQNVCDLVVRGEGEGAIVKIARGHSLDSIPGITWRSESGSVIINQPNLQYANLDELPFPAYRKLPMKKYRSALGAAKRSPSIGMITSRGCPGKCTFCYSGMFGSKIRFMSADKIFDHISFLKKAYGIREISFYDDTFTANRKRVEQLCEILINKKTDMSWVCFARVDTVDRELLLLMKKAGCHQINFGFESADDDILKAINKRITTSRVASVVSLMKNAGIDTRGAFMIGNPGETEESIGKTIEYSINLGIEYALYNITTPFPGTELYRWAKERGLLKHMQWHLYDLSHPIMELPTVSSETVGKYYHLAYKKYYLRLSYILSRLLSVRTRFDIMIYVNAFIGILKMLMIGNKK